MRFIVRSSYTRFRSFRAVASLPGFAAPANLFADLGGSFVAAVLVVPVPPLVRRGLRTAFRSFLPLLLSPERGHVEVTPGGTHRFVAAAIDEVGAEYFVAVSDECIVAVPLI